MTTFDEREAAFENKFAYDEEMAFKAVARRDRALGFWAAELLGKTGSEAEDYAIELVRADVDDPRHLAVFYKLQEDLKNLVSKEQIQLNMIEFHRVARAELAEGG